MTAPILTPLRRIGTPNGDVLHAMKAVDPGYAGFGEAYFSCVAAGATKGWKRHTRMVLNLVVSSGRMRFHLRDDGGRAAAVELCPDDPARHARLTVPPGIWMAFEAAGSGPAMVLNLASIGHDPAEAETAPLDRFGFGTGPLEALEASGHAPGDRATGHP